MRIVNKSVDKSPIQFFVKDEGGNDILIKLSYYQFVFTPTDEKTRTVNLHGRRGNLFIDFEEKPEYINYFKPYKNADLKRIEAIISGEYKKEESVDQNPYKELETEIPIKKEELENKVEKNSEEAKIEKKVKELKQRKEEESVKKDVEPVSEDIPLEDLFERELGEYLDEDEGDHGDDKIIESDEVDFGDLKNSKIFNHSNEEELEEELDVNISKEKEEGKDTTSPKSKKTKTRKSKVGRPKKRGRPKKKKPVGRPRKNKK